MSEKNKGSLDMDFLLKLILLIIFAGILLTALYSIFKRFGIWK